MKRMLLCFSLLGCFLFSVNPFVRSESFSAQLTNQCVSVLSTQASTSTGEEQPEISHGNFDQVDMFTGTISYTYKINLPPGTAGMQPSINLIYRSSEENGWFGMGWFIEGFAFIERSFRLGVPKYTNMDDYILNIDGSTYDLVRDASNISGIGYYHTKCETWMKIYFDGNYWTVTKNDGTRLEIGSQTRAFTRIWALDKSIDKCGNFIEYYYYRDINGEIYPERIKYTFNQNQVLSKVKSVNFLRETRKDNIFPHGRWMDYRIKEIQIFIEGTLVDRYSISYKESNCTGRSLISSISRFGCGTTAEVTSMGYYSDSGSVTWSSSLRNDMPTGGWNTDFGDLNGDGCDDYFVEEYNGSTRLVYPMYNYGSGSFYKSLLGVDLGNSSHPTVTDINGDGRADFLVAGSYKKPPYIGGLGYMGWGESNSWFCSASPDDYLFVDLNNDAVLDRIDKYNGRTVYCSSPGGSGFSTGSYASPHYLGNDYAAFVDLNGDGYTDLHCSSNAYINNKRGGWYDPSFPDLCVWDKPASVNIILREWWRDFNGDGLADFVSGGKTYLNNSKGWTQTSWEGSSIKKLKMEFDVNGDGLSDLWNENFVLYIRRPNGAMTVRSPFLYGGKCLFLNKDPYPDFIHRGSAGTYVYLNNTKPDLLTSLKLPYGGQIKYDYVTAEIKSFLKTGWRRGGTFYKYVIKKVTTNDQTEFPETAKDDGVYTTTFHYPNGRYERTTREFLGFDWVKKEHPNGESTKTYFSQDIKTAGRILAVENYNSDDKLRYKETNTWSVRDVIGSLGYAVMLDNQIVEWKGKYPSTAKTEFTYDTYGNIENESRLGEVNFQGDEVTLERQYVNNREDWLIGLPSRERVIDANGKILSDRLFWYDQMPLGQASKGLLSEEKAYLDVFLGVSCDNNSFYFANCYRPSENTRDPHPYVKYLYDDFSLAP